MIQINKQGNAIVIEFTDNDKYLFDGTIEIAPNELMVVVDESNMATFKRVSNGDTLFAQRVEDIQINGVTAAKDTVIDLFGSIGYTSGGGSGTGAVSSVNGQTGDVVITAAGLGAMTKAQADAAYQAKGDYALKSEIPSIEGLATKEELEEKLEVFQVNAPMAFSRDEATQDLHLSIDLSNLATKEELNDKQDTLVSGENIKTVNGESILGNGNIVIKETIDAELNAESENPVQNKVITSSLEGKADSSTVESLSTEIATVSTNVANLTTKVNEDSDKIASLDTEMGNKQATLVSGTNIKTINNLSILGEGNIEITGGGTITVDSELSETSENPVQNKVINSALSGKADTSALDGKVDKVEGKSLVSDTEITKLEGLKSQTEIDTAIADAKKAGTDAQTNLNTHIANTENPHQVTKEQVGLGNVDNTSDADKPISTAVLTALNAKANSSDLEGKQDTLVSGTNIKTINNESILGSGNIEIQGGEETFEVYQNVTDPSSPEAELNKKIYDLIKSGVYPKVYLNKNSTLKLFNISIDVDGNYIILRFPYVIQEENKLINQWYVHIDPDGTSSWYYYDTPNIYDVTGSYLTNSNGKAAAKQIDIATVTAKGQGLADSYDVKLYVDSHSSGVTVDAELSTESINPVQNKIITAALDGKQAVGDYALKSEIPDTSSLATKTELNNLSQEVEHKADKTSVYTMDEVNTKLATKQATLVAGANITLSDPDTEGKVTITATQPDISGITTTVEELTGEVAALSTDKQDNLVSGTNIKTINGESILGAGNIVIQGGGSEAKQVYYKKIGGSLTSELIASNKAIYDDIVAGNHPSLYINIALYGGSNEYYNITAYELSGSTLYLKADKVNPNSLEITSSITVQYVSQLIRMDSEGNASEEYNPSSNVLGYINSEFEISKTDGYLTVNGNKISAKQTDIANATTKGTGLADAYDVKQYVDAHSGGSITVDTEMSDTSENAVQNKVIKAYIDNIVGNILTKLQEINGTV